MSVTIRNLYDFSLQQIFDHIANHLLTQGEKSYDEDRELCMYRGPNGLKCAVGSIIPDDIYSPLMEDNTALGLMNMLDMPHTGLRVQLLTSLQSTHDDTAVDDWEDKLMEVAEMFGLSSNVVTQHKAQA